MVRFVAAANSERTFVMGTSASGANSCICQSVTRTRMLLSASTFAVYVDFSTQKAHLRCRSNCSRLYRHFPNCMRNRVYETVRCTSVCLSQHGPRQQTPQKKTLLFRPGRHGIAIDCCTAHSSTACGKRMRAVPRSQRE